MIIARNIRVGSENHKSKALLSLIDECLLGWVRSKTLFIRKPMF